MPALPPRPSVEHLRKQAKRLARERSLHLASAQRALAKTYGFRNWTELVCEASRATGNHNEAAPPLLAAVRAGDVERVRQLLADGSNPRVGDGHELPLNIAAQRGPLALVETLIAGGALIWQTDGAGRTALDTARRGRTRERQAIVALLDRSAIADPAFRAAVEAIHSGNVEELSRLFDAQPRLLHERNVGPQAYRMAARHDYFRDPKLFWFVANNPTLVERTAPNIVEITRVMIERGVEREDLDYTLGLVMTGSSVREQGHQIPLMRLLLSAGALADRDMMLSTAGHGEVAVLREMLESGRPMNAPIAAALSDQRSLAALLVNADHDDVQAAFGLAIINHHIEAAQLALDAGADVNAFLPVHSHSTALHQAAADDRADIVDFLLTRGARTDARDSLWSATPLDWAAYGNNEAARVALSRPKAVAVILSRSLKGAQTGRPIGNQFETAGDTAGLPPPTCRKTDVVVQHPKHRHAFLFALSVALWVLTVDQFTKWLVMIRLAPGNGNDVIPGMVSWTYVKNPRGAYGLFGDQPWFLVIMAVCVLGFFAYAFRYFLARSPTTQLAYGFIVGGALGNIIDRVRYGFVVDFISLRPFPIFEVFNVADACVSLGVALLIVSSFFPRKAHSASQRSVP